MQKHLFLSVFQINSHFAYFLKAAIKFYYIYIYLFILFLGNVHRIVLQQSVWLIVSAEAELFFEFFYVGHKESEKESAEFWQRTRHDT